MNPSVEKSIPWTNRSTWLMIFLALLTALRLVFTGQIELSADEAYYYQWSQRLDWAYFSKGPGIALAIRTATELFGPSVSSIRFFSPLCGLGTSLLLFFLARRLYNERVAVWTAVMINCIPIFNVGSIVMTIDPLSIFFWTAALFTFWIALEKSPQFTWFWPFTGVLIGFGFLAKYTNVVEVVSILLVLSLTRKYRREFLRPGFWMLLGAFIPFALPPIVWNSQHEWITLEHLSDRGNLNTPFGIHPTEFLNYAGQHAGVYSPLIFLGLVFAIWRAWPRAEIQFKVRYLLAFSLPLLVMYFLLAFKHAGEPNWTAPGFVSLGILAVAIWLELGDAKAWARWFAGSALALGILLTTLMFNTDLARSAGIRWNYDYDPGGKLLGWRSACEQVGEFRRDYEQKNGKPVFLIGCSYGVCSLLAYYMPDARAEMPGFPPVFIPESQNIENQYSLWHRYDEMTDLTEVAKSALKTGDPASPSHKELGEAMEALPQDPGDDSEDALEARQRFVAALLAVNPTLPLDEFYTAEQGVNLFYGRDALYITDRDENHVPNSLKESFQTTELVAQFDETRRGLPLRSIRIFACHGYHSLPL
ncbi:MAG: glycosyltransferase family 39 protein [Chthoniobacteraceae bacterium]